MKINYDWNVIKKQLQGSPKKHYQKSHPKKIFSKIYKKFIEKKKTYILSKKGMSKKILQKSLKTEKNKPYIVTHWHASLNNNLYNI